MLCAAISVLVGATPPGGVAAANNLLQASSWTRVMQPVSKLARVLNVANVVVCELLSGS